MTFEEILPGLKAKKKYVRTGWGGAENYVQLFDTIEQNGVALEVTPYFLINVSGEGEGFSKNRRACARPIPELTPVISTRLVMNFHPVCR